jgi:ribonuclease P protein component
MVGAFALPDRLSSGHALQRLTSKAQFQAVLAGPPVAKTPHFAMHLTSLEARSGEVLLFPVAKAWLGVLIPKRWARRAVTRNTIRRQIYEVARAHEVSLPCAAMVVRLRSEFSRKQFISATSTPLKVAIRAELQELVARTSHLPRSPKHASPV